MGVLNLTVRVLNLSQDVSQSDLESLFSYCGNVEKIKLQRQAQSPNFFIVLPFFVKRLYDLSSSHFPAGSLGTKIVRSRLW